MPSSIDVLKPKPADPIADFERDEHLPDVTPETRERIAQARLKQTRQGLHELLHGGGWFNDKQASGEAP